MSQERLHSLLMLYIHKDNYLEAMRDFILSRVYSATFNLILSNILNNTIHLLPVQLSLFDVHDLEIFNWR